MSDQVLFWCCIILSIAVTQMRKCVLWWYYSGLANI